MHVRHVAALILCVTTSSLAAQSQDDVWTLTADVAPGSRYIGETVANGMLGMTTTAEPFGSGSVWMQGVFDHTPAKGDVMVRTFNVGQMALTIDGTPISRASQVSHFRQVLDLKHGTMTTTFDYEDKAFVSYTWYALRQLPYTALVDVTIRAKRPIDLTPTLTPEPPSGIHDVQYSERRFQDGSTPAVPLSLVTGLARTDSGALQLAASRAFLFDSVTESSTVHGAASAHGVPAISFAKHLDAGAVFHFATAGSTISSSQNSNPKDEVERLTVLAALKGSKELIAQHKQAWEDLWRSDIRVEGDEQTQRDIHAMIYHLYAFTRADGAVALPPMGLSNNGFYGRVFWDSETWMFPVLLALHPEMAKPLLEYRYERLGAAHRNAIANGYRGALYPWQSSITGDEDTPLCCIPGIMEHHVTAAVGNAAWQYYEVTQDKNWLRERGWPILEATADFWASRVVRKEDGQFHIDRVQGADEYAMDIADDAYTNAAARANLANAIRAAAVLNVPAHSEWEPVRNGLAILKFPDGVTREHETYRGETIKQADVNLLAYPLKEITEPVAVRRDLEYYGSRVDLAHGPAMTRSVLAILYAKLDLPERAYELFKSSYVPHQRPPFGVIAETPASDNTYFTTGVGGVLQTMLYGFGGLEITEEGLKQRQTKLPKAWKSLTLTGIGSNHLEYRLK